MYILNLKTKVIQECKNRDVINMCKKHPDEYALSDEKEKLKASEMKEPEGGNKKLSDMKIEELRSVAAEYEVDAYESLSKKELLEILKDVTE